MTQQILAWTRWLKCHVTFAQRFQRTNGWLDGSTDESEAESESKEAIFPPVDNLLVCCLRAHSSLSDDGHSGIGCDDDDASPVRIFLRTRALSQMELTSKSRMRKKRSERKKQLGGINLFRFRWNLLVFVPPFVSLYFSLSLSRTHTHSFALFASLSLPFPYANQKEPSVAHFNCGFLDSKSSNIGH